MGGGRWSASDWDKYSSKTYSGKSTKDIFRTAKMDNDLNPNGVTRESRDSIDNPNSNAIILALDVTGSMGCVLDSCVRGLGTLVQEIYDKKPVTDPHIMCMGIGDVTCDNSPVQATQFEADLRIAKQLEKIYLEGGGGGNSFESYTAAWYFAAVHTQIDCFEKRGKKGYLFTIGDEEPAPVLSAFDVKKFFGTTPQANLSAQDLLEIASRQYHVFHLMVEQGSHFRYNGDTVVQKWTELLGQRAIRLVDHTKLAEVIVSTIRVNEGEAHDTVISTWDGSTSLVVKKAISGLTKTTEPTQELVEF
jgi:hypothetical protein